MLNAERITLDLRSAFSVKLYALRVQHSSSPNTLTGPFMSMLRLLSRVAFICNVCFMIAVIFLWMNHPPEGEIVSIIIVLGYVLAVIINVVVNFWYGMRMALRKPLRSFIPAWLMIINFLFLIPQLILFLK